MHNITRTLRATGVVLAAGLLVTSCSSKDDASSPQSSASASKPSLEKKYTSTHQEPAGDSLLKPDKTQKHPLWADQTKITQTSDGDQVYSYYEPGAVESNAENTAFVAVVFPDQEKCLGGGPSTRGLAPHANVQAAYETIQDVTTNDPNVKANTPDMQSSPTVSDVPTTISDAYWEMMDPSRTGTTIKPYYSVVDDGDGATAVACSVLYVNRTYGPMGFDPSNFAKAITQGDQLAASIRGEKQSDTSSSASASA